MEDVKSNIVRLVNTKQKLFTDVSDAIWANPELGFKEYKSVSILIDALEKENFQIKTEIAEIPTAFQASWGNGYPTIGFLGEYDALGAGSLAAAVALKDFMEENNLTGTVMYFGCPAEEAGCGKTFMARAGVFNCLDAAFTWHPHSCNAIWSASSLSEIDVIFKLKGQTAYAAACPHLGRSALDAAELMNVGVNYLREHIIDQARIHYAYLNVGGTAPNVGELPIV